MIPTSRGFDTLNSLSRIAAVLFLTEVLAHSQDSVRPSLTGAAASEARRPAFHDKPNYNIKAGPVYFDLRGSFSFEIVDNVNLAEKDRKADLIFRPGITLDAFWQISPINALRLDVGFAYAKYVNQKALDTKTVLIAPNSQLAFDVFVGDFRINFHDRFSVQDDPLSQATLSNVTNYIHFDNTAGVSVLWDLNDVKIVLGYDHYTFKAITVQFAYLDRSEEQFTLSGSYRLSDATSVGLDLGSAIVSYDQSINNDALAYHAGAFLETQISNYLRLRVSAGYQIMNFSSGGAVRDSSSQSAPFGDLSLSHRLNNYVTETLRIGYEAQLGLNSNSEAHTYARYSASWRVNHTVTLAINGFVEDARESAVVNPENAFQYGGGLGFGYQLTKKLNVGVHYDLAVKNSNLADRSYYQNRLMLNFTYDF